MIHFHLLAVGIACRPLRQRQLCTAGVFVCTLLLTPLVCAAESASPSFEERAAQVQQKQIELALERYDTDVKHQLAEQRIARQALYALVFFGAIAAILYFVHLRQLRRQEDARLKMHAAQIILDSQYGTSGKAKAQALSAVFPAELKLFRSIFESGDLALGRLELLRLLSRNPDNQVEILRAYSLLFPDSHEDNEVIGRLLKAVPDLQ